MYIYIVYNLTYTEHQNFLKIISLKCLKWKVTLKYTIVKILWFKFSDSKKIDIIYSLIERFPIFSSIYLICM